MQRQDGPEAEILAAARRLDRLREIRPAPTRASAITEVIEQHRRLLKRVHRELGAVAEAWEDLVPSALRKRCSAIRLQGGVLDVAASDAAARYEFDRWLRGGGRNALADAAGAPLNRVRVSIDAAPFELDT